MSNERHIKKRSGLLIVISIVIILISLITTASVSFINYQQYLDAVYSVHATEAMNAAKLIESYLTTDEWDHYAQALISHYRGELRQRDLDAMAEDNSFVEAYGRIQTLTDNMELEGVTIFTIDQDAMNRTVPESFVDTDSDVLLFMMDFYMSDRDDPVYELGDTDYWWSDFADFDDYRTLFTQIISSHEDSSLHEDLSDGTPLLTEYYPIMDGDRFVAMVCVSVSVNEIRGFMHSFFIRSLLTGLGITLALVALAIAFFYLRIVKPLRVMTEEADRFIASNTVVSEKLPTIRTHDELQQLAESFLRMEIDLRTYVEQVTKVTAEKEHIRTELSVATKIQEDMLPRIFPPYPDRTEFSIFASMDPAKEVGGDFYDFFLIDHDHLAMIIADVAGKGVPASLFMVIAKSLLKNRALMGGSPAEILRDVNYQLCDGNDANMFVTVWMAILDLTSGQGVAANAGHEHPIRRNAGGVYELVEYRHSPAVALFDGMKFREHTFEVKPGDRIFVYTDGLPEATNAADELFGTQRVLDILNRNVNAPLTDILPAMTAAVDRFVGEAPQFDDLTMLVFEYHGPQTQGPDNH